MSCHHLGRNASFRPRIIEIAGGTITGLTSLAIPTNGEFRARGIQALRIAGAAGSTITATGNLTLGIGPRAVNGFGTQGTLQVARTCTLLDANDVVFDSLAFVSLGMASIRGRSLPRTDCRSILVATLQDSAPSAPERFGQATINNGHITGNSAAQRITLPGYVKGVGTFDNVNFTGTFSPGLSPTILSVGNIPSSPTITLLLELGGTTPGSGYDQIQSSGALALTACALQVMLINGFTPALGDQFAVLSFASRTGDFTSYAGLMLGGHIKLRPTFTPTGLLLTARPAIDGDINLDGTVNIFDINSVSSNWSTAGPQGDANGDGIVNIFDINLISSNWGAKRADGRARAVDLDPRVVRPGFGAVWTRWTH